MTNYHIHQWCRQHNWTEVRQLDNGDWVAFPPGGVIETPLPIKSYQFEEYTMAKLRAVMNALIPIVAAIIAGIIVLIISPLFLAAKIRQLCKK